jgi:hypothetical protein
MAIDENEEIQYDERYLEIDFEKAGILPNFAGYILIRERYFQDRGVSIAVFNKVTGEELESYFIPNGVTHVATAVDVVWKINLIIRKLTEEYGQIRHINRYF